MERSTEAARNREGGYAGDMPEEKRGPVREWISDAVDKVRELAAGQPLAPQDRPRVGVALSGGFARGIAHLGVLRVLEGHQIPIHCISGTSVGALIGAAYASGTSLDEMERQSAHTRFSDFGRWTLSRMGLATNQRLEDFLARFTTFRRFEDLKIPLAVAATDLGAGETVYFTKGDLAMAIRASCAYPGLFLPVENAGRTLVDGFVTDPMPHEGARLLGADIVIGVHLATSGLSHRPTSMFEVIGRSFSILQERSEHHWRKRCDILIEPGVSDVMWDEFDKTPQMIAAGMAAAKVAMPQIQAALQSPRRRKAESYSR